MKTLNRRTFNEIATQVLEEVKQDVLNEYGRRQMMAKRHEKSGCQVTADKHAAIARGLDEALMWIDTRIEESKTRVF